MTLSSGIPDTHSVRTLLEGASFGSADNPLAIDSATSAQSQTIFELAEPSGSVLAYNGLERSTFDTVVIGTEKRRSRFCEGGTTYLGVRPVMAQFLALADILALHETLGWDFGTLPAQVVAAQLAAVREA